MSFEIIAYLIQWISILGTIGRINNEHDSLFQRQLTCYGNRFTMSQNYQTKS